jgi:hypothetical protein
MILMLAPAPDMSFSGMPSGSTYVSNQYGLITILSDAVADQTALQDAGCYTLSRSAAGDDTASPRWPTSMLPILAPSCLGAQAFPVHDVPGIWRRWQ